jgi:hypothetical protein
MLGSSPKQPEAAGLNSRSMIRRLIGFEEDRCHRHALSREYFLILCQLFSVERQNIDTFDGEFGKIRRSHDMQSICGRRSHQDSLIGKKNAIFALGFRAVHGTIRKRQHIRGLETVI